VSHRGEGATELPAIEDTQTRDERPIENRANLSENPCPKARFGILGIEYQTFLLEARESNKLRKSN
jgi:hypothetical protein